jgi:hypothetical protein
VSARDNPAKHPAISAAAGAAAVAVVGTKAAYRAVAALPIVGSLMRRGVAQLSDLGDKFVTRSIDPARALVTAIAVDVVESVLDEIELTALVRERVDIDAIVADIDIDAIVNRIDLIGLANRVIEGVDLPAIIRESTGSVTADVMDDVRSQGERADDFVSGIVDRVLGRSRDEQ